MNNFKRRALIFVTFFGSCLAISLLTASLNTNYWTTAECKRTTDNKEKSNGTVNMGLFFYEASLNFGLGDRHYPEKMLGSEGILYLERQFLVYELYIATIACVVAGIFFGIISAMLAIVNTGSNPVEAICHVPGIVNLARNACEIRKNVFPLIKPKTLLLRRIRWSLGSIWEEIS